MKRAVSIGGLVLIVLALGPDTFALDPRRPLSQFGHDAWRVEDGLPQDAVLAVTQTRDGYLWLGTTGGLVRFDGVRFTVFDKANTDALGHNQISALLEDREGSLWIGTFGGGLMRLRDRRFTTYTTRHGLAHDVVKAICQDRKGGIWVATLAHGVSRLEDGRFRTYSTADGVAHDDVFALAPSRDGGVWMATSGGLSHFVDGRFTTRTTRDGLPSNRLVSVYEDRKGRVWAGTRDGGLARLEDGRFSVFTVRDGLSSDVVNSVYEDRTGALWLGTKDRGLNRFFDGRFSAYTTRDGLSSDAVYGVAEDREGSLWIGTFGGGLSRLRDTRFTSYTTLNGLPHDYVRSVFEGRDGRIWLATFGGGLASFEGERFVSLVQREGLPQDRLYCVLEDRAGDLWVGTDGAGLVRRHRGRLIRYTARDGLAHDNVRALYQDRAGNLWVGTSGGLSRFSGGRFESYTAAQGLSNDAVHAIFEDRDGALWLGTWGGGLNRLFGGKLTSYSRQDGVTNDFILSFYEDVEGSLWIGTLGGGLLRRKDGRFKAYTTKEGLHEDLVYQVFEDDARNLWLTSNKGVSRVPKQDFDDLDHGLLRSLRSVSFGTADGMRTRECTSGSQPLGAKSRDGRLWIPTQRGLAVVDPARLRGNSVPPPVTIEEVRIDGRPLDPGATPSAPPGRGELEFRYTALTFLGPEKVRFRYRLEGLEDAWVEAGTRRLATYSNIPAGRYRFSVVACNSDGVWTDSGAAFAFRLLPHFYQTYWFYALWALAFGAAGFALHRLRVRRVEAVFGAVLAERTRMARELHDTLAQGFAGIAIHLDSAVASLPDGLPDARAHLGLARSLVRESLAEARRSVLDLRPQALETGDLPSALSEMAARLQGGSQIEVEVTGAPRRLPSAVESHLLRIAQEALTNALRHACARMIRVRLEFGADRIWLRVCDDGHGLDGGLAEQPGPGHLGLAGIRERVAALGGQLRVQSDAGRGTELLVEIPLSHGDPKTSAVQPTH